MAKRTLSTEQQNQIRGISRVTWVGLWVNVSICLLKFVAGFLSNSRAVVADGVHSLSDMVTDIVVLVGVHFWVAPADDDHQYGHQRLESLVSLIIGVFLASAGIGICIDAIDRLHTPETKAVGSLFAIGVLLLSCISKEWLYRWTLKKGKELQSPAVEANAWDHRSDAVSSVPAIIGVGISLWFPAYAFVDRIAAILVALFILHAAWVICRPAIDALLDKGADLETQAKIRTFAETVPGVIEVHGLRTRYLGAGLGVDMHAAVNAHLTVSEGNTIAHALADALMSEAASEAIGVRIVDALVHVDPDTEICRWEPFTGRDNASFLFGTKLPPPQDK